MCKLFGVSTQRAVTLRQVVVAPVVTPVAPQAVDGVDLVHVVGARPDPVLIDGHISGTGEACADNVTAPAGAEAIVGIAGGTEARCSL